jgi:hypothetical protein
MQIEDIKRTELTQSERDVLTDDRARWRKMSGGSHLDDWLAYYPGLSIRRRLAMRIAFVNKPEGKGYNTAFSQLMQADGLDSKDKMWSHVLWLRDDPEHERVLRELREAMTPGERSRLNSPISARQRVEKVTKAREGGTEEKMSQSPLAMWKNRAAEHARKIAHLEEQLASAEQRQEDGSLFDLKNDSADNIAMAIVGNVGRDKAANIAKQIAEKLKRKRQPAG